MNQLDETIQSKIHEKFKALSLREQLIVYAKVVHSNLFRVSKNDLLGMNKRKVSRVYRSFVSSLKPIAKKKKNGLHSNRKKRKKQSKN